MYPTQTSLEIYTTCQFYLQYYNLQYLPSTTNSKELSISCNKNPRANRDHPKPNTKIPFSTSTTISQRVAPHTQVLLQKCSLLIGIIYFQNHLDIIFSHALQVQNKRERLPLRLSSEGCVSTSYSEPLRRPENRGSSKAQGRTSHVTGVRMVAKNRQAR